MSSVRLFICNVALTVDPQMLEDMFKSIVNIVHFKLITKNDKRYGFITVSCQQDCDSLIEMFNGYELDGRPMIVRLCNRKKIPGNDKNIYNHCKGCNCFRKSHPYKTHSYHRDVKPSDNNYTINDEYIENYSTVYSPNINYNQTYSPSVNYSQTHLRSANHNQTYSSNAGRYSPQFISQSHSKNIYSPRLGCEETLSNNIQTSHKSSETALYDPADPFTIVSQNYDPTEFVEQKTKNTSDSKCNKSIDSVPSIDTINCVESSHITNTSARYLSQKNTENDCTLDNSNENSKHILQFLQNIQKN